MAFGLQAGSCVVDKMGVDPWCMLAGSLHVLCCLIAVRSYC